MFFTNRGHEHLRRRQCAFFCIENGNIPSLRGIALPKVIAVQMPVKANSKNTGFLKRGSRSLTNDVSKKNLLGHGGVCLIHL